MPNLLVPLVQALPQLPVVVPQFRQRRLQLFGVPAPPVPIAAIGDVGARGGYRGCSVGPIEGLLRGRWLGDIGGIGDAPWGL